MTAPFIVCGWCTPDYRCWACKLVTSLDDRGIPHDIVEVPKLPGSWEANTMAKPAHLLDAMDRHPDKVTVFLDVDCQVLGDLSPLAKIGGDVAFYLRTKCRSGGARFGFRSGTVVVRPTPGARAYVHAWLDAAAEAPWGDVDQAAQMFAMGRAPGTSFTMLGVEYCATAGDCVPEPVILHDSASRGVRKIKPWQRRLRRLWRVLFAVFHTILGGQVVGHMRKGLR
jgi:hypothetical protein